MGSDFRMAPRETYPLERLGQEPAVAAVRGSAQAVVWLKRLRRRGLEVLIPLWRHVHNKSSAPTVVGNERGQPMIRCSQSMASSWASRPRLSNNVRNHSTVSSLEGRN